MRIDSVVITGVGTLGSFGAGNEALTAALAEGRALTTELPDPAGYRHAGAATRASLCGHVPLEGWLDPARARRMSAPSRYAVAAARMALADAGLPLCAESDEVRSVAMATTFGAGVFTERLLAEIVTSGPRTASPFLFTDCVANAPAGQIAIDVRARGSNSTVVQREAGAVLAVIEGALDVAAGRSHLCVAGHVEEIGVLVHAVLARLRAVCPPDPDGVLRARPFAPDRRGFVAGEGSTALVLEPAAAARARGARVLARIVAAVRAFDPTAPRADWGLGHEVLAERLRGGLARAGLRPADIGAIVSCASGSRRGDALEARVLRATFGDLLPPVLAPKAVTGEYGGGNLGAALSILAGATCGLPPGTAADPDLGIRLHAGPMPAPMRRILVTALASGGAAAWLVLERDAT
ncbi:MAG: beta-ketoacyl synthase N-terminal-like domain-containing protein [Planctomycetota bacterium]